MSFAFGEFECGRRRNSVSRCSEGMTNSVRHGHATKIYVSIAQADNNLIIIIEDNGQGCKNVKPGFGIHHLTERIDLLQGRIRYYGDKGFD